MTSYRKPPRRDAGRGSRPSRPRSSSSRRVRRIKLGAPTKRINASLIFGCVLLLVIGGRLVQLQFLDGTAYAAAGEQGRLQTTVLDAPRGQILDAQGRPLAYSVESRLVAADPTVIKSVDRPALATLLAAKFGMPYQQAMLAIMAKGRYSVIAREADPEATKQVLNAQINDHSVVGIVATPTQKRVYPGGSVGAEVVGFVSQDGVGKAGIEASMQSKLNGVNGQMVYQRAPDGTVIPSGVQKQTAAVAGSNIELTIDSDLQYITQSAVDAFQASTGAAGVSVVVLNAKTGQVAAMYGTPGYNSSNPGSAGPGDLSNPTVSDVLEPGSINKVTTFGPALETGVIMPRTVLTVPGEIKIADITVHDAWVHSDVDYTATGILAVSSNVGTLMINEKLNTSLFYSYLKKYGLGSKTGIELPGESPGILVPPDQWSGSQKGNIPIGQGISMTPLQMASMYQAIANDGVRVAPRIVKDVISANGTKTTPSAPPTTRVLTANTASQLRLMLEAVTGPGGTAKTANISGYRIGGKTGTGQRPNPACNCYAGGGYYHTFVGMAPLENPQYVISIAVDDPNVVVKGGATPLFSTLMSQILQTKGVAPSAQPSPTYQLTAN